MLGTAENLVLADTSLGIHIEGTTNKNVRFYYIVLYYVIHSRYAFFDEGSVKLTLPSLRYTEPISGEEVHSLFEKNSHT